MTSSNGNIFHVTGLLCREFPAQRPVTQSFDVSFDRRLNTQLCKQSWGCWCEMPSHPLWHHHNGYEIETYHANFIYISFTSHAWHVRCMQSRSMRLHCIFYGIISCLIICYLVRQPSEPHHQSGQTCWIMTWTGFYWAWWKSVLARNNCISSW